MQVQKDDVRHNILKAATDEFFNNGYQASSLREIAAVAGITPGNIYRYFANKYSLYEEVTRPAWDSIHSLFDQVSWDINTCDQSIADIAQEIAKVFIDNQKQFIILIKEDSENLGTNAKQIIINWLESRINESLRVNIEPEKIDKILIASLSVAITEAMICVFLSFDGNEKLLNQRIYILTQHIFNNLKDIFGGEELPC